MSRENLWKTLQVSGIKSMSPAHENFIRCKFTNRANLNVPFLTHFGKTPIIAAGNRAGNFEKADLCSGTYTW